MIMNDKDIKNLQAENALMRECLEWYASNFEMVRIGDFPKLKDRSD